MNFVASVAAIPDAVTHWTPGNTVIRSIERTTQQVTTYTRCAEMQNDTQHVGYGGTCPPLLQIAGHGQWRRNKFESGGTGSERKWGGHRSGANRLKSVSWSCPSTCFGSKSTISRFGELFRDSQYSLVSFFCLLFSYWRCPLCPAICKSRGTCPRAPWTRRHWARGHHKQKNYKQLTDQTVYTAHHESPHQND